MASAVSRPLASLNSIVVPSHAHPFSRAAWASGVMPGCWSATRQRRAPLQQRASQHVATDGEVADRSQIRVAKNNVHVFDERANLPIDALTTCTG
jgi:hypothetical protein